MASKKKSAKKTTLSVGIMKSLIAGREEMKLRTAYVVLPDQKAVVRILEILAPLSTEVRTLTLQAVEANKRYPHLRTCGSSDAYTSVVMPEALASRKTRSASVAGWREPADGSAK